MSDTTGWGALSVAELAEQLLPGWHRLTARPKGQRDGVLQRLSLPQVEGLLVAELRGKRRSYVLKRLHQRLARLRTDEQLEELQTAARLLDKGAKLEQLRGLEWLPR